MSFMGFVNKVIDMDWSPKCEHSFCNKDAKLQVHGGHIYCSDWCYKNSIVLQYSRNQPRLSREEYSCQAGCGRHRGIKKDGTMFKYCSQECHQRATHSSEHYFQPNYQRSNSQQVSHHQQVPQPVQHQSHDNFSLYPCDSILFYNKDQPFYEFTNFYPCKIDIDDCVWSSTEHYFQAQKFVFTPYYYQIRDAPTPRQAFDISRRSDVSRWKRTDWEKVKNRVMLKALLAKFLQNDHLRVMLVKTGTRKLVENSPSDSYWGVGSDGSGQNLLGELLMQVREICFGKPQKRYEKITDDLIDLSDTQCGTVIDTEHSEKSQIPCEETGNSLMDLNSHETHGPQDCINLPTNLPGATDIATPQNNQTMPMETDQSTNGAEVKDIKETLI